MEPSGDPGENQVLVTMLKENEEENAQHESKANADFFFICSMHLIVLLPNHLLIRL